MCKFPGLAHFALSPLPFGGVNTPQGAVCKSPGAFVRSVAYTALALAAADGGQSDGAEERQSNGGRFRNPGAQIRQLT